jgi:hypothetical protein
MKIDLFLFCTERITKIFPMRVRKLLTGGIWSEPLNMLDAYRGGETNDVQEQSTTLSRGGIPLSGWSVMMLKGPIPPQQAKWDMGVFHPVVMKSGAHFKPSRRVFTLFP